MEVKLLSMGFRGWKDAVVIAFATGSFLGYVPIASGTVTSLAGIVLAYLLMPHPALFLFVTVLVFLLGVPAASYAGKFFGREDPGEVTIDEICGMLIALYALPFTWVVVVSTFILYRIFDIFKPFPARQFESLPSGLGIMADDVVAGFYANICIHLLVWLFRIVAA
jgi:phosphatidylglycerophosphatase A